MDILHVVTLGLLKAIHGFLIILAIMATSSSHCVQIKQGGTFRPKMCASHIKLGFLHLLTFIIEPLPFHLIDQDLHPLWILHCLIYEIIDHMLLSLSQFIIVTLKIERSWGSV